MEYLDMYVIHEDERGVFRGITNKYTWGEINFIETIGGVRRGDHYHKFTKELFYILEGCIKINIHNIVTKKDNSFVVKPNMIFIIDPYEVHTFITLENSKWINMLSHKLDAEDPDIHKFNK